VNTETCEALGLDFEAIKAAFGPYCTQINSITTAESFSDLSN
jgi:putative ABC transport system substrate-binding protein